jgi:hypothetical protein
MEVLPFVTGPFRCALLRRHDTPVRTDAIVRLAAPEDAAARAFLKWNAVVVEHFFRAEAATRS